MPAGRPSRSRTRVPRERMVRLCSSRHPLWSISLWIVSRSWACGGRGDTYGVQDSLLDADPRLDAIAAARVSLVPGASCCT